ncbi:MAG: peptidase M48 Ste24p, partial [Sphingomonadales bacterium]
MRALTLLAATAALLLSSCSDEPAPDYEAGITEEDHATGAEQHEKLLAQFGGEYKGARQDYLRAVGERVARAAGLDDQCTFTLVNSDVANAFAVPGCFIYVTRGLMGIVNSEDELASVLGHEVGHIVAQHGQRQQQRSLWSTLGVLAISLAGSEQLTRLAAGAAQFFGLRYSREQEYESDELGIRYLQKAGYDPYAAADMLAALGRQQSFVAASGGEDEARSMPEWASSHPLTDKRIDRTRGLAEATGIADDAVPEKEAPYLAAVDGLLYGDDPQQGFVMGRRFAHPVMRIGFEAPQGFTLTNSPQAIMISGPDGVRGEFGGGGMGSGGIEAYARRLVEQALGDTASEVGTAEQTMVNGLPAIILPVRIQAEQGIVPIAIVAYDAGRAQAYHFIIAAPEGDSQAGAIRQLFASFRLLHGEGREQLT